MHFQIFIVMAFPRKTAFWTIFLSAPQAPPPLKAKILFLLSSPSLNGCLVSHHCCDPCRATECRAHVAANSHNFRGVARVSRYITHPPQRKPCRTYLATPLALCHRKLPCKNGSRYTGVQQLHLHRSRYTVPLRIDAFC